MLRSDLPPFWNHRTVRALAAVLCLLFAVAFIPSASAQTFSLEMNDFQPFAVAPSQTAASSITLSPNTGFTGSVDLSCSVVAVSGTSSTVDPECQMSPPNVTPPGGATATVITVFNGTSATPGEYTVTVTGTSTADGTTQTGSKNITVLAVTGQFNLSIANVLAPSSVPAGSGAQATISVNPVNSYSGTVTMACASIIPLVVYPPQCTFAYPGGLTSVPVSPGVPGLVTLTINTFNKSTPITQNASRRLFYAIWLPAPMLALIGIRRKRFRKASALLAILVLSASLLLIPACNTTSYTTPSTSTGVTPNNTYTITLVGTDANGNISTNTGTAAPTLTLTVTAPVN